MIFISKIKPEDQIDKVVEKSKHSHRTDALVDSQTHTKQMNKDY